MHKASPGPSPEAEAPASPGPLLRHHRRSRGWTQAQLAARSGYSERVIRKAEAGGLVRPCTLEVLAETLATPEQPLTPADLRGEPLAVVQAYWRLRELHSYGYPSHCGHLLHDDYVLEVHREDAGDCIAGVWRGVEGLNALFEQLGRHYRPLGGSIRFFASEGRASALRHGRAQPIRNAQGNPLGPDAEPIETWFLNEWVVEDGRIRREDLYTDGLVWKRAMNPEAAAAAAELAAGG